jgi:hypothetical protein
MPRISLPTRNDREISSISGTEPRKINTLRAGFPHNGRESFFLATARHIFPTAADIMIGSERSLAAQRRIPYSYM